MRFLFILALAFMLVPVVAAADPIILINGVNATGITNQRLDNATVTFDSTGNIYITAPGYKPVYVDTVTNSQPAASPVLPPSTVVDPLNNDREFTIKNPNNYPIIMLANFNQPGLLGYTVDVFVNGQYVKKFNQNDAQVSLDMAPYLHKGLNEIRYRTSLAGSAGSSPSATVDIYLSKVTSKQGNALELMGEYGHVVIKSTDGERMYQVNYTIE